MDSEKNRNDWCPVEERLPEDNMTCFVKTERDEVGIGYMKTLSQGKRVWVFSMKNEFPPMGSRLVAWKDVRY